MFYKIFLNISQHGIYVMNYFLAQFCVYNALPVLLPINFIKSINKS